MSTLFSLREVTESNVNAVISGLFAFSNFPHLPELFIHACSVAKSSSCHLLKVKKFKGFFVILSFLGIQIAIMHANSSLA